MEDQSNGTTSLKEPIACTGRERMEFERYVRQGFNGSDDSLPGRILDAKLLAFYRTADDALVAIAGLKAPAKQHRDDIFEMADARVNTADYNLELGWVFVVPGHRGNRIATSLCRALLARAPSSCVFATTRPDNTAMTRILINLGFTRVGKPFPRRNEELALFLRSRPTV